MRTAAIFALALSFALVGLFARASMDALRTSDEPAALQHFRFADHPVARAPDPARAADRISERGDRPTLWDEAD